MLANMRKILDDTRYSVILIYVSKSRYIYLNNNFSYKDALIEVWQILIEQIYIFSECLYLGES